jgi:hypothetical protein
MTNNFVRSILGCAVILCYTLTICSMSSAYTKDQSSEPARYVIDSGPHLSGIGSLNTVSLDSQTPTTWRAVFVWIFGPLLAVASVLLIIGALISSSMSLLPELPKNAEATDALARVPITGPSGGRRRAFAPRIIKDPGIYKSVA